MTLGWIRQPGLADQKTAPPSLLDGLASREHPHHSAGLGEQSQGQGSPAAIFQQWRYLQQNRLRYLFDRFDGQLFALHLIFQLIAILIGEVFADCRI